MSNTPPSTQAIIDIGSNSVRLVVYDGPARAPSVLFNEKVSAGLGRGLGDGAALDRGAVAQALRALKRFRVVAQAMGVDEIRKKTFNRLGLEGVQSALWLPQEGRCHPWSSIFR